MKIRPLLICMTFATGGAGAASAAELDYVWRAGAMYSDNFERLPSGLERDGWAAVAGLEVRGARPVGRLRYDALADLSYYEYLGGGFDSELLGRASLSGVYDFIPESFSWNALLRYDQVREDILRPLAAGNRESEVTFSTGPTLRARFSNVLEGQLDLRYTRQEYSERPFDSETLGGRAMLLRRANPQSLLGLGYSYDDVSYISGGGASALDFRRQEVFGRLEREGVRTRVELEVGYADVSGQLVDDGDALVRARLTRRLTPMLSGHLGYIREYPTSETTMLDLGSPPVGGGPDTSLLTAAPRLTTTLEAGLELDRDRTGAGLVYANHRENALVAGGGRRNFHEIRGDISRQFTPRSRGRVFAAWTTERLSPLDEKFDESMVGGEYTLLFGTALGLDLRVEYRDRDAGTLVSGYSEFSGGIFLRYGGSLGRSRTP